MVSSCATRLRMVVLFVSLSPASMKDHEGMTRLSLRVTEPSITSKRPIAMTTSSEAICLSCRHTQVVRSPKTVFDCSSPLLATAASPCTPETLARTEGASTEIVYVALSLGVLLWGKPAMVPIGCPRRIAPSFVPFQPSKAPSLSTCTTGVPL